MVQWLGLCAPNAEGPGLIPGQETRGHTLQPSLRMPPQDQTAHMPQVDPLQPNKQTLITKENKKKLCAH